MIHGILRNNDCVICNRLNSFVTFYLFQIFKIQFSMDWNELRWASLSRLCNCQDFCSELPLLPTQLCYVTHIIMGFNHLQPKYCKTLCNYCGISALEKFILNYLDSKHLQYLTETLHGTYVDFCWLFLYDKYKVE
jgi:hypothetical protein